MTLLPTLWAIVYVGVLVLALIGIMNRLFVSIPRRVAVLLFVVLALSWLAIGVGIPSERLLVQAPYSGSFDVGSGHGNPLHDDLLYKIVPSLQAQLDELHTGRWPLWNSWTGAGMPLLADPQSQPLQPLVLPLVLLSPSTVPSALMILRLAVALLFGFLLLRRLGLRESSALLGAAIYGFGGFLILWLGWPLATTAALLPAMLYGVDRLIHSARSPILGTEWRRDAWLLLVAGLGFLLAGHPESTLHGMVVIAVFAVCRLWETESSQSRSAAFRLAGAGLIVAGLAAPVLLPTLDYLPQSRRAVSLAARGADGSVEGLFGEMAGDLAGKQQIADRSSGDLTKNLIGLVAPGALGNGRFGAYWGSVNTNEDTSGFAGTLTWLVAILAFSIPGRRFPVQRMAGLGVVVSAVLALQPPVLVAFLDRTPGLAISATSHRRATMILVLCLAYLAAIAGDRVTSLKSSADGSVRRRMSLIVLVSGAALAAVVAWSYWSHSDPTGAGRLDLLRPAYAVLQLGALALGIGLLLWLIRNAGLASASQCRRAITVLTVTLVVELVAVHGVAWWWSIGSRSVAYYPSTPILDRLSDELEQDADDGRVGFRMAALNDALRPNAATVLRLPDARIDNPMSPARYNRLVGDLYQPDSRTAGRFTVGDHPVLDLMGVRYLLTEAAALPPGRSELIERTADGALWRRTRALDRLFLPASAVRVDDDARWQPVDGNEDFAVLAGIDRMPTGDRWQATRSALGTALDRLFVERVETTRVSARLVSDQPRLMASSVYQDGGWRCLLDGTRFEAVTVNALFAGCWLPSTSSASSTDRSADRGRVELLYRPRHWITGWWIAAFAGAFGLSGLSRWRSIGSAKNMLSSSARGRL